MSSARWLFLCLVVVYTPGSSHPEDFFSIGSPGTHFEEYLYRADRRQTSEHWIATASGGFHALSEWERAHEQNRLSRRHAEWVIGTLPTADVVWLAGELDSLTRRFSFVTESGTPVLDHEYIDDDLLQWTEQVGIIVDTWYQKWHRESEQMIAEAVSRAADEYRSELRTQLHELLSDRAGKVLREQNRIVDDAKHRLLSVRLGDTRSLQRKTGEETAYAQAGRISRETLLLLEQTTIPADRIATQYPYQLLLDADQWKHQFQERFERGLSEWADAEQRLLEQRIGWENEQRVTYLEGEQVWDRAYDDMSNARATWMREMFNRIAQGRDRWNSALEQFDDLASAEMDNLIVSVQTDAALLTGDLRRLLDAFDHADGVSQLGHANLDYLLHERSRLQYDGLTAIASRDYLDEQILYWHETAERAAEQMGAVELEIETVRNRLTESLPRSAVDPVFREIERVSAILDLLDHQVAEANDPQYVPGLWRDQRSGLIAVLEQLRELASEPKRTANTAFDHRYQSLVDERTTLHESADYVAFMLELVADDERILPHALSLSMELIVHAAEQLFVFPSDFMFQPEPLRLLDRELPMYEVPGTLEIDPFAAGDSAAMHARSNDLVAWLTGLEKVGPTGLRDFALAYHYEYSLGQFENTHAPEVIHAANGDQNFRGLVDHAHVRADVRGALEAAGIDAFARIVADDMLLRHYRFFTAVVASDQIDFEPVGIQSFIEKDLARVAVAHVERRAREAERRLRNSTGWIRRNIFGQRPWRPVQRRREQMATFSDGGARERAELIRAASVGAGSLESLRRTVQSMTVGSVASSGAAAIGDLMALLTLQPSVSARTLVRDHASAIPNESDLVSAILQVDEAIQRQLYAVEESIDQRARQLDQQREREMAGYLGLSPADSADRALIQGTVAELFSRNSYSEEARWSIEVGSALAMTRYSATGRRQALVAAIEALSGKHAVSLTGLLTVKAHQFAIDRQEIRHRGDVWEARMVELSRSRQWHEAEQRLAADRDEWRERTRARYVANERLWQQRARDLDGARRSWIAEASIAAVTSGAAAAAGRSAIDASPLIAEVERTVLPLLEATLPAGTDNGWNAPQFGNLGDLLDRAVSIGRHPGRVSQVLSARVPPVRMDTAVARSTEELADLIGEAVHRGTATIAAMQMRQRVEQTRERIDSAIVSANRMTAKRFSDLLEASGFAAAGSLFQRRVVIDRSLFGGERRETQRIEAYRDFKRPAFDPGVDLSERGLAQLSGEVIESTVAQAIERLKAYMVLIFGAAVEGSTAPRPELDAGFILEFERALAAFAQSARYQEFHDMDGLFQFHVGYAPVMSDRDPAKVRHAGYGETGRIMLGFMRYEANQSRGMMMLESSAWDIPMWDSTGSRFEAPSVRSVTTVGVSIAASIVGQPWVALALTAANQAAFATLDTSVAGHDAAATWTQAGKNALASSAATVTGGVFSGFGQYGTGFFEHGLAGVSVGGSAIDARLLGSASIAAGRQVSTTVAQSAIHASNAGSAGLSFDAARFRRSAFGSSSVRGYASGTVGAAVSSGLQSNWKLDKQAFAHLDLNDRFGTDELARFLGGATTELSMYALDGNATVNLLSVTDVLTLGNLGRPPTAGAWADHGLLELQLARGNQGGMRIGGAGLNVGLSSLGAVSESVDELFGMKRVQSDIDNAMVLHSDIGRVSDRALFQHEAAFVGISPEWPLLAGELEKVRSNKSRENVDGLFRDGAKREEYGQAFIDQQLALAFTQQDLPASQFLLSSHFDTSGSFEIAYGLYERNETTLITMFVGEKAYAGSEQYGSPTYDRRLSLFLDYFEKDLRSAGDSADVSTIYGSTLISDPRAPTPGSPIDAVAFVERALGEDNAAIVQPVLTAANRLPELFADLLREGANRFSVDRFNAAVDLVSSTGLIGSDSLYTVMAAGNPTARFTASSAVEQNRFAFLPAYRAYGGRSAGTAFTNYVHDDPGYFQVEVGYHNGRIHEISRTAIEQSDYERVKELIANQPALIDERRRLGEALELYEHAGLSHLHSQLSHRLESEIRSAQHYRGLDTFCNLHVNEYSIAYGALNLQNYGTAELTANMIQDLLIRGSPSAQGRFVEVDASLAGAAGRNNLLVIASESRPAGNGHLAPVVDATWVRHGDDRSDYSVVPTVNNVGLSYGTMSIEQAFGVDAEPRFFMWVPASR